MTELASAGAAIHSSFAFRSIMQAMARPGRIFGLDMPVTAPEPMMASTAAVALTLCDFQTPIWLAPGFRGAALQHYLRFNTGAPLTEDATAAHFALLEAHDMAERALDFMAGTHEYPDRSTTLVIQVEGFLLGDVELSGPGIPSRIPFGASGLDQSFWCSMEQNHARFPIGVDVILAGPGQVAALPRSTAIHVPESV